MSHTPSGTRGPAWLSLAGSLRMPPAEPPVAEGSAAGHPGEDSQCSGGVAGSAASVEHRLRRLLGAATSRFDQMRADMREMKRVKEQHDALLGGLEHLLQV